MLFIELRLKCYDVILCAHGCHMRFCCEACGAENLTITRGTIGRIHVNGPKAITLAPSDETPL